MKVLVEGKHLPIVAILRGVQPSEVCSIGELLIEQGITLIEVPLNSPDPFTSIQNLQQSFGDKAVIGAGTVLEIDDVKRLKQLNSKLVVSPNCNQEVIQFSIENNMLSMPGILTPSELFSAIDAGANNIKVFPVGALGANYLANLKAVTPAGIRLLAVGGVNPTNMPAFWLAGARGFGIGGDLFKPGMKLAEIESNIKDILFAWSDIQSEYNS